MSSYVVDVLGGGVEVNVDGIIIVLMYIIVNVDYDNVGDVLNVIDIIFDDVLFWDVDVGENGVFSVVYGKDKIVSVIINVVNGAIFVVSSDVINGL